MARAAPAAGGGAHGAVLVLHDITDLRRADQIRRDFVANVSHELRTPLTAIRGYVEALSEGDAADERQRFLDIVARHTLRMERLVKDLLRLARLDAGQETLDVDLRATREAGARCRRPTSLRRPSRAGSARGRRRARRRNPCPAIPQSCTTCCATWSRTRPPTRRSTRRSRSMPRRPGGRVAHHCVRRRARDSRGGSVARIRAVLSRRQITRARPGRHRAGPGNREAPRRAARRRACAPRTAPEAAPA